MSIEDLRRLSSEELVRRFEDLLSSPFTDDTLTFLREELLRRLGSRPLSTEDIAKMTGKDLRRRREERMISVGDLARKANLSVITINRMESGSLYHLETKRKVLLALGEHIDLETPSSPRDGSSPLPCHNGNRVRPLREACLMTQVELADKAKISLRTLHSVEKGAGCHLSTKRKILLALGLRFEDKDYVFPNSPQLAE